MGQNDQILEKEIKRAETEREAEYYRKIISCFEPTEVERKTKYWLDKGYPHCAVNPITGSLRL